jgi:putative transposase
MGVIGAFLFGERTERFLFLVPHRACLHEMNKTLHYRLYPSKMQRTTLNAWLALCCEVYNAALVERQDAYRLVGTSLYTGVEKRTGRLILSKVGQIKMVMHRPIQGTLKTAIVKRTASGKWFISLSVETDTASEPLPPSEDLVGIDVGLSTFAFLSTGEQIENPRFLREEEHHLARAHRRLSKAQQGTKRREQRPKVVARVHERVRWRRENFNRQQVACLIKRFGLIAVEALVVRSMVQNPKLAKSIADAAWSSFFTHLFGVRVYECPACGLVIDRDHNGSKNILAAACEAVGRHGRVFPEAHAL